MTDRDLVRTAASDSETADLVAAVKEQAEAISRLTVLVEKLLSANSGGYDAVKTEDRLIVLNPDAVEAAPKRKRWMEAA